MLPASGELSDATDPGRWAVEFGWEGHRCVAYVRPAKVRLLSSTARSVTGSFPELAVLAQGCPPGGMVLDGTVVALDEAGRPSRGPLLRRTATLAPDDALRAEVPVGYVITDLLWCDGRRIMDLPYRRRRSELEALDLAGPKILVPPSFGLDEADLVARTAERYGLDGLHLKRLDVPYQPGRRTRHWLRVPLRRRRQVLVAGWVPAGGSGSGGPGSGGAGSAGPGPGGSGTRPAAGRERVAAVLLALPGPDGPRYVGRVGVGAADADARTLVRAPVVDAPPRDVPEGIADGARWLAPGLVAAVEHRGRTAAGRLALPSWRGLVPPDEQDAELAAHIEVAAHAEAAASAGAHAETGGAPGTAPATASAPATAEAAGGARSTPAGRGKRTSAGRAAPASSTATAAPPAGRRPATDPPAEDRPATDGRTAHRPTADRSTEDRPTAERSAIERPTAERPATDRATAERSAAERPAAGRSGTKSPSTDRAAAARAAADQHVADRSATDPSATDRPGAEVPATGRSAADRSSTDRSAADRPTADQSTVDQPATGPSARPGAEQSAAGPAEEPVPPDRPGPWHGPLSRRLEQHFVYNTLNTIAALVRTDPPQARELLLGFADLSRAADRAEEPAIRLDEELAAVRAYLQIERTRFGTRLHAEVDDPREAGADPAAAVAPLMVLAAVRRGVQEEIEPVPEGGAVHVRLSGGSCRVEVRPARPDRPDAADDPFVLLSLPLDVPAG
ncbi:ATP dependent DNA ligase domain-containing protein [Pseudonocardia ammonioxydans]|uniref:DNA ligase (ATP) n=1 Tax=Pseudonocardia ammonioxydans TaxID=260086 RepID=A0A1I4TZD4_PSUAM|nr:histidine kinase [Pseudonocardia ammonioxydans]SFM81997.1 ATP dependent DNA ligase domain-containing protein [Pseudonocardia ammonioxydans]